MQPGIFSKLLVETLFYIFYRYMSMQLKLLVVNALTCQMNYNDFSCAACRKMRRNYMLQMNCMSFLS